MFRIAVDKQKDMSKLSTLNVYVFIVMWCAMCNVQNILIIDFNKKVNLFIAKYKIIKNIIKLFYLKINIKVQNISMCIWQVDWAIF